MEATSVICNYSIVTTADARSIQVHGLILCINPVCSSAPKFCMSHYTPLVLVYFIEVHMEWRKIWSPWLRWSWLGMHAVPCIFKGYQYSGDIYTTTVPGWLCTPVCFLCRNSKLNYKDWQVLLGTFYLGYLHVLSWTFVCHKSLTTLWLWTKCWRLFNRLIFSCKYSFRKGVWFFPLNLMQLFFFLVLVDRQKQHNKIK